MTNPPPEAIEALVNALRTKSAMINMGEKIAWGSETSLMDQAADMLTALAQPDPTGGWCSDMEAAPRDGTRILVWVSGRADIAYYAKSILDGPLWHLRREGFCSDRWSPQPTAWQRITPPVRGQKKE